MARTVTSPNARTPRAVVLVLDDEHQLRRAAADDVTRSVRQRARGGRPVSLALAGGSTPRRLYELLATEPYRSRIPWRLLHVFWGDERCVPPYHPASNFRMAREALLARVPIPAANIHRVPTEYIDPHSVAASYERTVRAFFHLRGHAWPAFDVIVLGLGEDGHTASLFPRAPALHERHRIALATIGGKPHVPRITLSIPVLNHAQHLLWLVNGMSKASIVRAVLAGPFRPQEIPAQQIQPVHGAALWLLDRAAASQLPANCLASGVGK